jgi:hypothetical protein
MPLGRVALVLVAALAGACGAGAGQGRVGAAPATSTSAGSAASEDDSRRDVLITLAALQLAAALEASEQQKEAYAELGHFEAATRLDAPLRPEVLAHVRSWSAADRKRVLAFIVAHPTYSTLYHAFALESFGPPPYFVPRDHGPATMNNAPELYAARAELAQLFAWAYGPGKTQELSSELARPWRAMQLPRAEIEAKKRAVLDYLTYPTNETLPTYAVVYDPLLREETGYGTNPREGEIVLVVGFTRTRAATEMLLVHELTHLPLERLLTSRPVMPALERAACADAKIGDHRSYEGFANYTIETLVRAISYRITGVTHDTGFLFEPFFAEQLAAYEALPQRDFMAWAPGMLDALARQYCAP